MQSRPPQIGFQGLYHQQIKTDIGFERYGAEYDNETSGILLRRRIEM
jgi:hypothetical protein